MFKHPVLSILLGGLLGNAVRADDARPAGVPRASRPGLVQSDPRVPDRGAALRFARGERPERGDPGAYVVIAWANPPAGSDRRGYQFWGDDRIIGREAMEFVLETVLGERPRDVFLVGNDWAAGSELDPLLRKLSKRHRIDVFGASTFGFNRVDLRAEPAEVKALVSKAIDRSRTTR
jgi:hypothetical protein